MPEVLNTLAYADLKLGKIDSAVESLDRVLAQVPDDLAASVMRAGADLLNHDTKGAEQTLLQACKIAPKSAEARRVLGDFYADQKRFPEAETQFQAALAIDPKDGPALLDLARLQVFENQSEAADATLERLAKMDGYHSIHAIFLFQTGRHEEAIRELEKLVERYPDDRGMRSNLVIAYRASGRAADADKLLAKALKSNPKDTDALLQRGEIAIGAKNYALAEGDLNQVLSLRPTDPEVHYLLAKLNQARGATLTYRQELSETLQLDPYLLAVRLELARDLSTTPDGARAALDLLDAAPSSQKDSMGILVQRNWSLWAVGDLQAMRKGIDEGLAHSRSSELLIQFGLWKLRTGDALGARSLLEEALKLDPTDLRAIKALTETYLAQKNSTLALQTVKDYAAKQPKSAPAQDFLGVLLMANGQQEQARAAFQAAKKDDPTFVRSDLALVQVDAAENKFEDARTRLQSVLAADGTNLTARLWLGNIEETMGNHEAAIQDFRKVIQADPANAQASNNLAYLLAEYENNTDEALKYAQKAVELAPEHAPYLDTIGWILYKRGFYTPAIGYLQQASSNSKPDAVWKYHLAMAYAKAGEVNRGKVELANALKLNPNLPEAKAAKDLLGGNP